MRNAIEDMIAEGEEVAVRMSFRGTHKGAMFGYAPSGKEITATDIVPSVSSKARSWRAGRNGTPGVSSSSSPGRAGDAVDATLTAGQRAAAGHIGESAVMTIEEELTDLALRIRAKLSTAWLRERSPVIRLDYDENRRAYNLPVLAASLGIPREAIERMHLGWVTPEHMKLFLSEVLHKLETRETRQ